MPKISETERSAIEAGDVWLEGGIFSGKPDFKKILDEPYPELTDEEKAFLEGPVEELCAAVNDWDVWRKRDIPEVAWDLIKKRRFWGMIIPKEYGGLGFSALAHSEVIKKLASRSLPLSITVMVPNSLGPAELLIRYGTSAQKRYYLPRLARGEEIPCFALTEPGAGSDAASIRSSGTVFKENDGKLYLKLNWRKRWITLGAVSTVLGLAFRLRDPENLLGRGEDLGITCALIPTDTPGVHIDRRHDPLWVPFYNSPTHGEDVVVPIESIIGGPERAGQGWHMVMESLAAGRGISLPAQCTGGAQYATRVASAHSVVREQFSLPIGKFEGIDEVLARMAGFTYLLEAARRLTCGAMNRGVRPAIISAISKYHSTEMHRKLVNDGMDIRGGIGISLGPKNLLAHEYIAAPIGITVEGANILTRTLVIFGQGLIRAHPYTLKEIEALERNDLQKFDRALFGHLESAAANLSRSLILGLTRGKFARKPARGVTSRYWQKLSWASARFAFLTDLFLFSYGGKLKRKEKIGGRFADILSWIYLTISVLKRFEEEGCIKEDIPLMRWCAEYGLAQIQSAFDGLAENSEIPVLGPVLRSYARVVWNLNPIGRPPGDHLELEIAKLVQKDSVQRNLRLTGGIFIPSDRDDPFFRLEEAFRLSLAAFDASNRLKDAVKKGWAKDASDAFSKNLLSSEEATLIRKAELARSNALQVDDFSLSEYFQKAPRGTAA